LPASVEVVADLYDHPWTYLTDFNIALIDRMAAVLNLPTHHQRSSEFNAPDHGWMKLLHLCQVVGADTYITGHGARNYFDHESFEQAGIDVMYLDYDLAPYPQRHTATLGFDPYVTSLDVLANASDPAACIGASLVPWRDFVRRESSAAKPQAAAVID
jgi:hypothetical protein